MIFKFKPALSLVSSTCHFPAIIADLLQSCISSPPLRSHLLQPIHAQALVAGLRSDLFINNLLIKGYSESGLLHEACQLFDGMPQRNIISWSSMISMYTQHFQAEDALFLFSCFRRSSTFSENPNEFILSSILRACCQSEVLTGCAVQVHGLAVKTGLALDVFVGTALINFYSRSGCMEQAMVIFEELPVRNSVTWTAILSGFCQMGRHELSLRMFSQMKASGVEPDMFVLSSLISACAAMEFLEGGRQAHGYVYRREVEMDVSVNNVLVDLYCKCSKVGTAKKVFERISSRNLVSWTTMISGYMQNSYDMDALALFSEMNRVGWRPDAFACTSALSSCGSLIALQHGKEVHAYTIKAYLWFDGYVNNALIDMYAKCDALDHAKVLFHAMNEQDVVSYNAMMEGYARHDEISEAFTLFNRMRSFSLHPSLLTFVSVIGVCASLSMVDTSKQVHCLIIKSGVTLEPFARSALVDVYSKCSYIDDARKVFDEMEERDLVMWNAMLFGYVQNGQGEEALKLFHQLFIVGMRPNEFTFTSVVAMASSFASLFHGSQFHAQITKVGLEFDSHVLNALIDMYAKCGSIEDARTLFEEINERDVACWNSMISRFAQHGHYKEALRIFESMVGKKVAPNYVTFVGVLTACCHGGLVEEGLSHFCAMKNGFGIEPGMEHYASVVNLLGCAGRLVEAKEFIEQMPVKPAAAVWRSLLSACRVYGDVELGRLAARKAISLDSNNSGSHVLMSNMLASKGMWEEVEKVRERMDQIGAVKEPGYSWIEVKKKVHVFIAKGLEHQEADVIYSMLDCLTLMLKAFGYVPYIA
ncbi:pentatricopeptide repeat-containing protein At4g39530 [Phalaenopsis equestris]|uniref:pentatricopeptide repeat-containing protein At4g39530 n=1 Tax=Phalaenopsis equestris TaxID=78828 RepID=UPI0009E2F1D9|nr:pentatricopeptide repeat-containing protein At4g39530 [Phalaenopsis equestris]